MEAVPIALIRAIVAPYGAKLFRKQKKPYVPPPYQQPSWMQRGGNYGPIYKPSEAPIVRITDWAKPNPLAMQDYEYTCWFGAMNFISNWSVCRVCRLVCWGRLEREAHLQKTECRHFLFMALARLRRDSRCFVCNIPKTITKFGGYFCDEECLSIWKHEENNEGGQRNFREALRLVGYKGDLA